tara:strand:- start:39537 stop:40778 length:1242 start_codon:yes stop_codon:yes gene_type:complete
MLGCAVVLGLLILETRHALGEEFEPTGEAVTATNQNIGNMFADMVPSDMDAREFWAAKVDEEVRADDLVSARGFLLAAPYMLDKRDAAAVTAAATTETTGRMDERLLAAAKLFLPDDVRARYERAVSPPSLTKASTTSVEDPEGLNDDPATEDIAPDVDDLIETDEDAMSDDDLAGVSPPTAQAESPDFFILGNARDLSYQSAGWIRGDRTDVFTLTISGLGLIAQDGLIEDFDPDWRFYQGASLVKSAIRARRLDPEFEDLLRTRLQRAMPEAVLHANLKAAFSQNSNLLIQSDVVYQAFAESIERDRLTPIVTDLTRIAELADERSTFAALTLLETVTSLRDLKRAELISHAGGDRAVTLAKYNGSEALEAATTIMDWTMRLIVLSTLLVAICLVMGWLSVGTVLRSLNRH